MEFICDVLHDLVPFVQLKKREKHPWRSVSFCKVAGQSVSRAIKMEHWPKMS